MRRDELKELHYIAHILNLPAILSHGILSHDRATLVPHTSVAMEIIQERREKVIVPGGKPLHKYANLYINARNKMMYLRRNQHEDLCVLRVKPDIIDLPNVVIADQNASSGWVRFTPAPKGLEYIDSDLIFSEYWTHPEDYIYEMRHGSVMCAEVLVPDIISPEFVNGIYVSCENVKIKIEKEIQNIQVSINPHMFFQ